MPWEHTRPRISRSAPSPTASFLSLEETSVPRGQRNFGAPGSHLKIQHFSWPWLQVQAFSPSTGTLTLSGSGGTPGSAYRLLTSTTLDLPASRWQVAASGLFDTNGQFTATTSYSAGDGPRFYVLTSP